MTTELIVFEELDPVNIFKKGGSAKLIKDVTKIVESHVNDVTTPEGQANIRSLAYTIAQTKTAAVKFGKNFISKKDQEVKDFKKEIKALETALGELQAKTRKPLTEHEAKEKLRVESIKAMIVEIKKLSETSNDNGYYSGVFLRDNLAKLKKVKLTEEVFAEFLGEAAVEKDMAIKKLERSIEEAEKREAEQAELEKLRKEAAEREAKEAAEKAQREQEERDARIAKEAEERAQAEAKRKAAEEAERVERERQEAEAEIARQKQARIDAEEKAKRDAIEEAKRVELEKKEAVKQAEEKATRERLAAAKAIADAERKAEEAAQKERDRIAAEKKAEEEATKKREADKAHKAKINNAAKTALELCGVDCKQAKAIVKAIATGKIPHVSISY